MTNTIWVTHKLDTLEVGMVIITMSGRRGYVFMKEGRMVGVQDLATKEKIVFDAVRREKEWHYMVEVPKPNQ